MGRHGVDYRPRRIEPLVTRLANEIREASKPIYCSACFNSQDLRHVDFDAACDRGYANDEAVQVTMDDLILCENCVREGARLLGMTDEQELHDKVEDLEAKLDATAKALRQARNYADTLEHAIGERPDPIKIDHRRRPRKEIAA
jgi:hypothetical protein